MRPHKGILDVEKFFALVTTADVVRKRNDGDVTGIRTGQRLNNNAGLRDSVFETDNAISNFYFSAVFVVHNFDVRVAI